MPIKSELLKQRTQLQVELDTAQKVAQSAMARAETAERALVQSRVRVGELSNDKKQLTEENLELRSEKKRLGQLVREEACINTQLKRDLREIRQELLRSQLNNARLDGYLQRVTATDKLETMQKIKDLCVGDIQSTQLGPRS